MIYETTGDKLHHDDRRHVLAAYIYRHTPDHCSAARPDSRPHGFTHASDDDWLRNTRFRVTRAGRLDRRTRHCTSNPTWPFNPEFKLTTNYAKGC